MTTVLLNNSYFDVYELISQTAKTSKVRRITGYNCPIQTVKNTSIQEDVFVPLTKENAKNASIILCVSNPEYGTKKFNHSPIGHHSHGTGSNSAILFESEFHFWRVMSFKK
jgi:hypothetical protein